MFSRLVRFSALLCLSALLIFVWSHVARADYLANFDTFPEGALAPLNGSFTDGGITFFGLDQGLGTARFVAEEANSSLGVAFSAPNVLGFGGYVPGSGYGFGVVKQFQMTSGTTVGSASLDLWSSNIPESVGNTITLMGFRNNVLVNQTSFSLLSTSGITYMPFILPAGIYDRFELAGSGPNDNGSFFALVDNVRFTSLASASAPEPSVLFLPILLLPLVRSLIHRRRYTE
jgi:hypothetical protein